MIFAFFWSRLLAQFEGLICPVNDISFIPQPITCDVIPPVFRPRDYIVPWINVSVNLMPIQLHALAYGVFASLVAPFGGFLASAIKRAYGIKDFDSFIPGHGGVMDRMDCQLIMLLFTWVHFNTFIKSQMTTIPRLLASASLLPLSDQRELYQLLGKQIATLQAADAQGITHMDALHHSNLLD
jgi:phosphatidate cytidylyltransferase